jgi:hypothetical protein
MASFLSYAGFRLKKKKDMKVEGDFLGGGRGPIGGGQERVIEGDECVRSTVLYSCIICQRKIFCIINIRQ